MYDGKIYITDARLCQPNIMRRIILYKYFLEVFSVMTYIGFRLMEGSTSRSHESASRKRSVSGLRSEVIPQWYISHAVGDTTTCS